MTPRELLVDVILRLGGKVAIYNDNPDMLIVVRGDQQPFVIDYDALTVATIRPGKSK